MEEKATVYIGYLILKYKGTTQEIIGNSSYYRGIHIVSLAKVPWFSIYLHSI